MTDQLDFETRLEERLRARAAIASRPFDAAVIARQAVTVSGRRRRIDRLEWLSTRPAFGSLVVALLLAIALLGAVVVIGALLRERRPLPTSPVSNGWIVVSANPKTIGSGEFGDIYLVGEGDAARRIIGADEDGIAQACPRFSPDGHSLAYGEARASEVVTNAHDDWPVRDRAVVLVRLNDAGEGSEPIMRVAVDSSAGAIPCPEWSPDGKYVAFRRSTELWIADAAAGQTTKFAVDGVRPVSHGEARKLSHDFDGFAWSRDGSRIAVPEHGHIRIVNVGDGNASLIPIEVETSSVVWMANDARIAYLATVGVGDAVAVRLVDPDGTNDIQISPDAAGLDVAFADLVGSPDGRRVAFFQKTFRPTADGSRMDPIQLLIAEPDRQTVVELPLATAFPYSLQQWSPDGERLLFMAASEVGFEVLSVAVERGSPAIVHSTNELNLEWSDSEMTWQPVFR
jgi:dipeptidyl aminopeptidase/acylaminoacyl peptidase